MKTNLYLGLIKYRPNVNWFEIYKLIKANSKEEAENKLKIWSDINVNDQNKILIITETL